MQERENGARRAGARERRRGPRWWTWMLAFLPAAAFTWGIHEFAHWRMGESLGYDMWISLNQVGLVSGEYDSVRDRILVAAAGPVVTIVQAIVALALIVRWRLVWAYPLLFLALWTRALAMGISAFNPNDEATISLLLGWSKWLLPALVVVPLLVMTIVGSRRLRIGWVRNGLAYVACSIVTAAIVLLDQGSLGVACCGLPAHWIGGEDAHRAARASVFDGPRGTGERDVTTGRTGVVSVERRRLVVERDGASAVVGAD